ncbi:MAG: hypothetical protein WC867_05530 [Candidatus Pacearchaeota archaeon]|jgi:hypothetical protein
MESQIIGIMIIIVGWILQLIHSWNGTKEIKKRFLILYAVGSAIVIILTSKENLKSVAFFNMIAMILSCLVLIRISSSSTIKKTVSKKKRK